MDKNQSLHPDCPDCATADAQLCAVKFGHRTKTLTFRCGGCGHRWNVDADAVVASPYDQFYSEAGSDERRIG
jgi:transcription elongation factor Elf1